jgi:hypothetical protein
MKYVALTHFLIKSSKTNGEDKNDSSDDLEENDEEIDENEDETKIITYHVLTHVWSFFKVLQCKIHYIKNDAMYYNTCWKKEEAGNRVVT